MRRAIDRLIELAASTSARVHIVHLADAGALDSIRAARASGVPITCRDSFVLNVRSPIR